jgi:hypothetical protein
MEGGEGASSTTSATTRLCASWGLARQRERAEGGTREREREREREECEGEGGVGWEIEGGGRHGEVE